MKLAKLLKDELFKMGGKAYKDDLVDRVVDKVYDERLVRRDVVKNTWRCLGYLTDSYDDISYDMETGVYSLE